MSTLRTLIKDTAVYGLSSMVGRFLNWLLTFVYTRVLIQEEFGQMTNLYAWAALLLVVLTYGMETSFFRFANKHERPGLVYSTTLWSVGVSSLLFALVGLTNATSIARWLSLGSEGTSVIGMLALITALDAFCAIPLGYLRFEQKPWRFMAVRMGFILLTIVMTLGVFYGLPWLAHVYPAAEQWLKGVSPLSLILGINLIGNGLQLLMLLPTLRKAERGFDAKLLKEMLGYAWPILLLGLVGAFSIQADKIIFPRLFDDPSEGAAQLGIYGACYKLAVIMVLFTQAFRYAYDPFVFAQSKKGGESAKQAYALSMRYYVIFTLFIFLLVMSAMELLKHFIDSSFHAGLPAVPIIMLGQLMFGVYFNLSLWYKLTDRTQWGAILSIIGCLITVVMIILFGRTWGFMACAWAGTVSSGLIMIISYILGQHYYPITYPLKALGGYALLTALLYTGELIISQALGGDNWVALGCNALAVLIFLAVVLRVENIKPSTLRLMR